MKKITVLLAVLMLLISSVNLMASCDSVDDAPTTEETVASAPVVSKESIVYEHAKEMMAEGKWEGASYLFESVKNDFDDADALYEKCWRYHLIEYAISFAIDNLKKELKDPDSLTIYDIEVHGRQSKYAADNYHYEVSIYYAAKNSFSAMVTNTYIYPVNGGNQYAKEDLDQSVDLSFMTITYIDLCNMTRSEYSTWSLGDFKLYEKSWANSNPENIWND